MAFFYRWRLVWWERFLLRKAQELFTLYPLHAIKTFFGATFLGYARKIEVFVHCWLTELLFDLRLKDIQLVLHVPVNIGEALLRSVVVCVLSLLVSECRNHALVELFNLDSRVFTVLVCGRTFWAYLAHSHVLHLLWGWVGNLRLLLLLLLVLLWLLFWVSIALRGSNLMLLLWGRSI